MITDVTGPVKTHVTIPCVTLVSMDERELRTRRFFLLIERLAEELGSVRKACAEIGVDPSYYHNLKNRPGNAVSPDRIKTICKKLRLRDAFFYDPAIGDTPDFHEFIGRETVEYDEDLGSPAVEAYIAGQAARGAPVSTEHQRELRALRSTLGPDHYTEEMVKGIHQGMKARDNLKALEPPPDETPIETERGQRALRPIKGGRKR